MARMVPVTITVADLPEVIAAFKEMGDEIARLKAERDEWEERYEWLLAQSGGTAPG